jgi:hypothetical protein
MLSQNQKRTLILIAFVLIAAGGFVTSIVADTTGEHVACQSQTATAITPDHVIGVDGSPVTTIPGETQEAVATACVTATDQTVTGPTTTVHDTTTQTVTVTTPAPPPPPPPAPPPANFFLSTTGSDTAACTASAPCKTFNRAYHVAGCGATVEVAAGTYPNQPVLTDATKATCSANVLFQPASGATVIVGSKTLATKTQGGTGIDVSGACHVTFSGFTIRGDAGADQNSCSITFLNDTSANGLPMVYAPTRDISFIGGSYGGTNRYQSQIYPGASSSVHNVNFLEDGVSLHDIRSDDLNQFHVECQLLSDALGYTVRNMKMWNCDVFDLSVGVFGNGQLSNGLVENNWFGSTLPSSQSGLGLNTNTTSWNGLNVRNNSALVQMRMPVCSGGCTNVRYSGNISPLFSSSTCVSAVVYRNNLWTGANGAKCNTSDKTASGASYVNSGTIPPDLHLLTSSAAIDAGDPANFPATDIDGQLRFFGFAPDAGADEAG